MTQLLKSLAVIPLLLTVTLAYGVECPCGHVVLDENVDLDNQLSCELVSKESPSYPTAYLSDGQLPMLQLAFSDEDKSCKTLNGGRYTWQYDNQELTSMEQAFVCAVEIIKSIPDEDLCPGDNPFVDE